MFTIYYFPFTPNPQTASVRYRGWYVMNRLRNEYNLNYEIFFPNFRNAFVLAGLILRLLFCRDDNNIYIFQKICKKGIYFWILKFILNRVSRSYYDMDDAVYISEDESIVKYFVSRVHCVIAAADHLKTWASKYNSRTVLITTMLSIPEWNYIESGSRPVIAWIGKFDHHKDDFLEILFPALRIVSIRLRFRFVGIDNKTDKMLIEDKFKNQPNIEIEFRDIDDWTDEERIVDSLRECDLGVMPLIDSNYNRSRSAFKLKQYSAAGIPALVSPVGETEKFIQEGVNGRICRSEEEWASNFVYYCETDNLKARELSRLCHEYALSSNYNIDKNIETYAEVLLGLNQRFEVLAKCPLCGSSKWLLKLSARDNLNDQKGFFYLSCCNNCGFHYQNPRVKRDYIDHFYPEYSHYFNFDYNADVSRFEYLRLKYVFDYFPGSKRKPLLRAIIKSLSYLKCAPPLPKFIGGGKMLVLGCGNGAEIYKFKKLGWGVKGVENNDYAVHHGQSKGISISQGNIEDIDSFRDDYGQYDAVVMMMVLEHIYEFRCVIDLCYKMLRDGGQLMLNVPTYRGSLRWFGPYAYPLQLPSHISFFRRRQLMQIIESNGFKIINTHYEPSRRDFIESFKCLASRSDNSLIKTLNHKAFLCPFSCMYAYLAQLGLSSRIRIVAKKSK